MPRYYFDIRDAQGLHRDDVGIDFPDMDRAIADISRDALPATNGDSVELFIRDHGDGPVRLSLSLTAERGASET